MKLRKLAAALTAAALGLSLGAPALAAESAEARLTKVTLAVKATLDIGDEYTEFYGEPNETMLGTKWELNWEAESKGLNVTATEEGKVLSLGVWETVSEENQGDFGPSFPAMTVGQAKERAEAFLARVLTQGEKAVFDEDSSVSSLNATSYYFRGGIELNGLPSPLRFSLRIRVSDGAVTSFRRDDVSDYVGALPNPGTSTTAAKAAGLLAGPLSMRLEYVMDDNGERAVLRYLPNSTDDYYVDAATGELVNLTELQRQLSRGDAGANKYLNASFAQEAPAEDAADSLSKAELEGVARLEGTLDQEALDKKVRSWKELGLDGFELAWATYRVERDSGGATPLPIAVSRDGSVVETAAETAPADTRVTATLTYVKKVGDAVSRRTVTLDAKTGELEEMSGYNAYDEGEAKLDEKAAQAKAETFLKALWPNQLAKCGLYDSAAATTRSGAFYFQFAQKENGYFYAGNTLTVRVSADDGSIMGFSRSFDDNVVFDDAEGLISEETALTAWAGSYPVELSYIAVPVQLDLLGPEAKPFISAGYSFYNALKPGYQLGERDAWYTGVDAKTGELVKPSYSYTTPTMEYDDLEGHWARVALNELAQYNVGWFGGKAEPDKALTQLDFVILLASANGYTFYPENGDIEFLYSYAIRQGLLTKEEQDENKVLTRSEAVKMLLDSLGYKQVAGLKGIFRCDFTDGDSIPEDELGYAALAQGLGIVSGDSQGRYAPSRPASRCEAAVMLWNYMKR